MAYITTLDRDMPDLLPMLNRSPGTHVSDVIHSLCIRHGHYEPRETGIEELTARFQLGLALEHAIIQRFAQHHEGEYVQPGELQLDGIFGTPDLLHLKTLRIEEMKLTWMSSKRGPDDEKFWRYWVQIKCYCMMTQTTLGRLHVCHINGDYKGGEPVYRVYDAQFTRSELIENWAMIKTHARRSDL